MSARQRLFQHGGDINSARLAFPGAPEPWLDLSTGINPVPYPVGALDPGLWTRLPAPAEIAALEQAAAARYGAPAAHVVAAPGAQALIQWLPRLFPAPAVAIPGPTYGGHATAWRAAGARVVDRVQPGAPAVIVNPNNPDGRRYSPAELRGMAAQASLLVVDEAFADFDAASAAPPEAVVLRSFGKAYGLAGVRLGFAIARPEIAATIRAALGAWAVSGPAVEIGRRALADAAWLAARPRPPRRRRRLARRAASPGGLRARRRDAAVPPRAARRRAPRLRRARRPRRADAAFRAARGLATVRRAAQPRPRAARGGAGGAVAGRRGTVFPPQALTARKRT